MFILESHEKRVGAKALLFLIFFNFTNKRLFFFFFPKEGCLFLVRNSVFSSLEYVDTQYVNCIDYSKLFFFLYYFVFVFFCSRKWPRIDRYLYLDRLLLLDFQILFLEQ